MCAQTQEELAVVLFGCLCDALCGDPSGAEGSNEAAVLAAQNDCVRVRLVQVVVELGEHLLTHMLTSLSFLFAE